MQKKEGNKKSLGIYVHIPFCVKKCDYCDFLSQTGSKNMQERYVRRLLSEIRCHAPLLGQYEPDSIFIGGGTPSILEPAWIAHILDALCLACGIKIKDTREGYIDVREKFRSADSPIEITIECNPGTLDLEKLYVYKKAGINRISLGLQSANDAELKLLGRIHTWEQFVQSANAVKEVFANWNVDLMSALPGQSTESYRQSLEKVLALEPPHLSAYSLIVEEGTPFYERYGADMQARDRGERPAVLPSEEEERRMYEMTKELLSRHGFSRYEISNYARSGYECRHNLRYWRRGDYIGFGLGAASCMDNVRWHNTENMEEYLTQPHKRQDVQHLTENEQMEECMFLGLRCMKGVDTEQFCRQFGRTVEMVFGEVLADLEKKELLKQTGKYIQLTQFGIDVSNYVLAQFLLEK